MRDLESVYDEKIAPLMGQIHAICKENDMPFLAVVQFQDRSFATTYIVPSPAEDTDADRPMRERLRSAHRLLTRDLTDYATQDGGAK